MLQGRLTHAHPSLRPVPACCPQFGKKHAICNSYLIFVMGSFAMYFCILTTIGLHNFWLDRASHKPWRIYRWVITGLFVAYMVVYLEVVVLFVRGAWLAGRTHLHEWEACWARGRAMP